METTDARKRRLEREATAAAEERAQAAADRIEAHYRRETERAWAQAGLDPSLLMWPDNQ